MAILFAIYCMFSWGSSDYMAGIATRTANTRVFGFYFQVVGATFIIPIAIILSASAHTMPEPRDIFIGIAWGAISALVGSTLFFYAMGRGNITVVSPVAGATLGIVPTLFSLLILRDHVNTLVGIGLLTGIAAIALISIAQRNTGRPTFSKVPVDVLLGLVCGAGIGVVLILADRSSSTANVWPLAIARVSGAIFLFISCRLSRVKITASAVQLKRWIPISVIDATGNAAFLFASHHGVLAPVAVIASLSPAISALLAMKFQRERIILVHAIGLVCAFVAIAAISWGSV